MTVTPLLAELAAERRRAILQDAEGYRRAKASRRPARASRLTLRVRPVRPDDSPLLVDIFTRLSPESRLARFLHPKPELTAADLRHLTRTDHHDHEALVALTRLRGKPVGVARFIRDHADPSSADVAVAVVDEWQDRGVGSMLVNRLRARALRENLAQFTALTSPTNLRARRLLAKAGEVSVVARDGATVSYRVVLPQPVPAPQRAGAPCARPGGA